MKKQNDNRLFNKLNTEFRVLQVLFRTSFQQPKQLNLLFNNI